MQIDRDLARRFEALRRSDQAVVPTFSALVRRPPARRQPVALRVALWAATVLLAVGGARLATRRVREEIPSILTWRSPTATLLRTPGQGLVRDIPTLRSSLLSDRPNLGGR